MERKICNRCGREMSLREATEMDPVTGIDVVKFRPACMNCREKPWRRR